MNTPSSPLWRVADAFPGSDIGVTFSPARPEKDLSGEPDIPVFSVHVWHNASRECLQFAEDLCAFMNKHNIKPPKGWEAQ